jgi:hypothetical protein
VSAPAAEYRPRRAVGGTISETGASVPTFGAPVTILPPRIARFSARLSF